jgi:MinD-like ATPase involved in chromosome partitioning or flagellar assembly
VSVPVLTAVTDPRWEADIVSSLARDDGVRVVRRCVDLADLLAAAAAGLARAVLLSADLRRLDRDALTRPAVAGVAVVGLVAPGDEAAERRLRQLGVTQVLVADAAAGDVSAALVAAVGAADTVDRLDYADPRVVLPAAVDGVTAVVDQQPPGGGRVIAVWGPTGAPGRTTVAVGVAAELAELGFPTLLVDADVYGGVIAQLLGLLDEAPGIAAACRLANNGSLDLPGLAELAVQVRPTLRVLTGIARAERWPELRPSALEVVLGLARSLAGYVVVDCGFGLERDEELSYDTVAPRRNGATLAALNAADTIVAVASGDPVGLQRYVRALGELSEAVPGRTLVTVVNRLRPGAIGGGDAEAQISAALSRYAGVTGVRYVPMDTDALDAALAAGRTLPEAAPNSPARQALQDLAAALTGRAQPRRRRRLMSRPRG